MWLSARMDLRQTWAGTVAVPGALGCFLWKLEMTVSVPQGCCKDHVESTERCVWLLGREF